MLTAVVAIRLRLEESEVSLFEEEDVNQVAAAVSEEYQFTQNDVDDFYKTGMKLKAEQNWGSDTNSKSTVTLSKTAAGTIKCDGCSGDTSDLVKPFWRYSKKTKKSGGKGVNSFSVPANTRFYNSKDTTQCMKKKYILMLGDSTIVENLNDMILLLAGGPKKVNPDKFYQDVTHVPAHGLLQYDTPSGHMVNTYTARNRNQTVELKDEDLLVKYRFTGAAKLAGNCGGLEVLLEDQVKAEIEQLVENGGRKPDAIIIHSAMHDMCHSQVHKDHLSSFYQSIDRVGTELIKPWTQKGINVIWRGSYRFPKEEQTVDNPKLGDYRVPAKLDLMAKQTVEKNGGKFVDIADLLANVHDESGCCQTINSATTTFPHLGAVSVYHTPKASTFLSQLVSYKILDAICHA
jgi:hypothetical protein